MSALAWTATRGRYATLNVAMIVLLITSVFVATLYAPRRPPPLASSS